MTEQELLNRIESIKEGWKSSEGIGKNVELHTLWMFVREVLYRYDLMEDQSQLNREFRELAGFAERLLTYKRHR